jgi:hypothetical protein
LLSHFFFQIIGDKARDGICCSYGKGGIVVSNSAGSILWEVDGRYGAGAEVYLNVSETAALVWAANNPDGTITGSWGMDGSGSGLFNGTGDSVSGGDDGDDDPISFDPSVDDINWPGAFPKPVGSSNLITINIQTDLFPDQTQWSWSMRTGPGTFEVIHSGIPLPNEGLMSYEEVVKSETIYKLTINDTLGDGNCCLSGLGWFTITNAIASTDFPEGTVVWRMTGDEFDATVDVFIWITADGNAQLADHKPGEGYAVIVTGERSFQVVVPKEDAADKSAGDIFT